MHGFFISRNCLNFIDTLHQHLLRGKTKRINVRKIASLKDLFNSPINEVFFEIKSDTQIDEISKILKDEGKTKVNINVITKDKNLKFKLKKHRNLNRKSLNLLRKREISAYIA